jgi:hypothetical protein
MITVVVGGLLSIVVIAIVVGVVDAFQASAWRRIAAERRESWEARQLELHGPGPQQVSLRDPAWDD